MKPPAFRAHAAISIAVAALQAACGHAGEPVTTSAQAMVHAQASPQGTSDDAVVLLRASESELICTATLVAPNLLLTTRHCVAVPGGPPGFQCTLQGELISPEAGAGTMGPDLPADTLEVYGAEVPRSVPLARGKQVISSGSNSMCRDDIAFVVLDRELSLPALALRVGHPPVKREPITLVGYGLTSTSQTLKLETQKRMRVTDQEVKWVGPAGTSGAIDAPPRMFLIDGPASCYGDSGGPAIADATGAVIGVFSMLLGGNCDKPGVDLYYTQTSPFQELALEAFAAAGAEPNFEPAPVADAGSDDGGTPADGPGPEAPSCATRALPAGDPSLAVTLLLAATCLRTRRRA